LKDVLKRGEGVSFMDAAHVSLVTNIVGLTVRLLVLGVLVVGLTAFFKKALPTRKKAKLSVDPIFLNNAMPCV
jgi:hypothetical protein